MYSWPLEPVEPLDIFFANIHYSIFPYFEERWGRKKRNLFLSLLSALIQAAPNYFSDKGLLSWLSCKVFLLYRYCHSFCLEGRLRCSFTLSKRAKEILESLGKKQYISKKTEYSVNLDLQCELRKYIFLKIQLLQMISTMQISLLQRAF